MSKSIQLYNREHVLQHDLVLGDTSKLPEVIIDQAGQYWLRVGFSLKYIQVYPVYCDTTALRVDITKLITSS